MAERKIPVSEKEICGLENSQWRLHWLFSYEVFKTGDTSMLNKYSIS